MNSDFGISGYPTMDQLATRSTGPIWIATVFSGLSRRRVAAGGVVVLTAGLAVALIASETFSWTDWLSLIVAVAAVLGTSVLVAEFLASRDGALRTAFAIVTMLAISVAASISLIASTPAEITALAVTCLLGAMAFWFWSLCQSKVRFNLGGAAPMLAGGLAMMLYVWIRGWTGWLDSDAAGVCLVVVVPAVSVASLCIRRDIALGGIALTVAILAALGGFADQIQLLVSIPGLLLVAVIIGDQSRASLVSRSIPIRDAVLAFTGVLLSVALGLFSLDDPVRGFVLGIAMLMAGLAVFTTARAIGDRELRVRELATINARVEAIARLDHLTGLPNRSALESRLLEEVERAVRYRHPMSVCFVDIDHFKTVNDSLGHAAGDRMLQQIAAVIRMTIRTPDFVARYGGEEFVVIAPGTWTEDAVMLGGRIQKAIAEMVDQPFGRPVTVSIGISGIPEHGTEASTVLERADQALYAAKFAGRNRVFIAGPEPDSPSP